MRPWPGINVSGSRCSSRRTSTGSPADAVRRSPRHGQDIPVESILPHGHLLPQREVLQRQLAARANSASQCPKDNSQPSDHDRPIADQSGQRKIVATDEFLEGTRFVIARFVASSLFLALAALVGLDAYTATHHIDSGGIAGSGAPIIGRACSTHDDRTVAHHRVGVRAPARPPRDRRVAHKRSTQNVLVRRCPPAPWRTSTKTAEGGDNARRPMS